MHAPKVAARLGSLGVLSAAETARRARASAGRRPTPCRRARAPCRRGPGPSKITGRPSKRGSDRNAIMPSTPISPSPRFACRSRFEPSAVIESLTCSAPRRSQPTTLSNSSITLPQRLRACARRSRRRTGGRSPGRRRAASAPPTRSISVASSSNERPSVPPAPAVSSSSSGHVSDSASASLITSAARLIASSTGPPSLQRRARVQDDADRAELRARRSAPPSATPATCRGSPGPRTRS